MWKKRWKAAAAAALCVGGTAWATIYTWVSGDGNWNGANRWTPQAITCDPYCHPNTVNDSALIDTETPVITLTDDFTINLLELVGAGIDERYVRFTTGGQTPYAVTAQSIEITATPVYFEQFARVKATGTDACAE